MRTGCGGQQNKRRNRGMTLVELTVSFVLLSIFCVCATMIISAVMQAYYDAKSTSYGMEVSGILSDWVTGQLEGALSDRQTMTASDGTAVSGTAMLLETNRVEFTNRDGSHVELTVDGDGYLCERYYAVVDDETGTVETKEVEWAFDENVYMGYRVTGLEFSKAGSDYPDNVICVHLSLTNGKYGDYDMTTYVQCDALDGNTDITVY